MATEWRLTKLRICGKRLRRAYSRCLLLEAHRLGLTWLLISVLQWVDLRVLDYCRLLMLLVLMRMLLLLVLWLLVLLRLVLLLTHGELLVLHCMCMPLVHLLNHWLWRVLLWASGI